MSNIKIIRNLKYKARGGWGVLQEDDRDAWVVRFMYNVGACM